MSDGKPYSLKDFAVRMKESPLITKMRLLAPGPIPGSLQHPFPVKLREDYLELVRGKGIFKRAENVQPSKVPLAGLTAIQRSVNMERLAQHLEDPRLVEEGTRAAGHGGKVDLPVITKIGGKMYVHDGTHRCCGAYLRGQKEILARVVDLDADPKS
jgi:hypothetical protein